MLQNTCNRQWDSYRPCAKARVWNVKRRRRVKLPVTTKYVRSRMARVPWRPPIGNASWGGSRKSAEPVAVRSQTRSVSYVSGHAGPLAVSKFRCSATAKQLDHPVLRAVQPAMQSATRPALKGCCRTGACNFEGRILGMYKNKSRKS